MVKNTQKCLPHKSLLIGICLLVIFIAKIADINAADQDLLFEISFDKRIVRADKAQGNPEALHFEGDLEFRPQIGYNNKFAYLRLPDEKLEYDAVGNFNPKAGTISFWFKALNWKPKGSKHLMALSTFKHLVSAKIKTTTGAATFSFYKYYKLSILSFLISPKLNIANNLCSINGAIMKQNKWYKVDCTWGDNKMNVFIDGKVISSSAYNKEYKKVASGKLLSGKIMITPKLWNNKYETYKDKTLIDDLKIYNRALSVSEIKRDYLKDLGKKIPDAELVAISIQGVDRNTGSLDQCIANFDLNGLDNSWKQAIKKGLVNSTLTITLNGKVLSKKNNLLKKLKFSITAKGINKKGLIETSLDIVNSATGKKLQLTKSTERPDTAWFGNQYGKEDFIPKPWTPIKVSGTKVSMWNRTYDFDGPFIKQVTIGDSKLLSKPTKLVIDSGNGPQKVIFAPGTIVEKRKDRVVFAGSGKSGDITVNYRNTVWFDGFSRIEFTLISKDKKINSMKLQYAVKPEFSKYMTTPTLVKFKQGGNVFQWKNANYRNFSQIWLMGDVNGFCWLPENEGNWVYPKDTKPVKVYKSKLGTEVALDIISKPVVLPAEVKYSFGFIATPTRPLPENYRTFALGSVKSKNVDAMTVGWGSCGFTHFASLIPTKNYNKNLNMVRKRDALAYPYSSPTMLADAEPVVKFFLNHWLVPGKGGFPVRHFADRTLSYNQVNLTPTYAFCDFFADKVENILSRNEKDVGGVYYDLVHPVYSSNSYVYGIFTDAFGREIPKQLTTLGVRECLMRTIKISRRYDKTLILHGQRFYNPALGGLGDYWWPGEQLNNQLTKNKFFYTDEMTQENYDVHFSSEKTGVGMINLPVISRTHREYRTKTGLAATDAMLGRMTLNDIISSDAQCYKPRVDKMWGIKKKYKIDSAKFIKFDRNNLYTSSNKNIVSSFYVFSDKKIFAVIYNQTQEHQTGTLTIPRYNDAYDAWNSKEMKMIGNKLKISMPKRGFMIVILKQGKKQG